MAQVFIRLYQVRKLQVDPNATGVASVVISSIPASVLPRVMVIHMFHGVSHVFANHLVDEKAWPSTKSVTSKADDCAGSLLFSI